MKQLIGNNSAETAYVVADYPYGFRLRTQIRYWVETKKNFGQRFVSQTLNPKNGNWNKPKAGTYYLAVVMYLDEKDYVQAAAQMARKSAATNEAPPMSPPSMSGCPKSSAALFALTLPP